MPPVGTSFVNVAVGLLRSQASRNGKILARLPRGTRVSVNHWENGEEVDKGEKRWAETHPDLQRNEFIYKNVLKQVPPVTVRTAVRSLFDAAAGRFENFIAQNGPEILARRIEYIECGGYAND